MLPPSQARDARAAAEVEETRAWLEVKSVERTALALVERAELEEEAQVGVLLAEQAALKRNAAFSMHGHALEACTGWRDEGGREERGQRG